MGGCSVEENQELPSALTLVLIGKTGNGKSATGNSILGTNSFDSKRSSSGVTLTSQLKTTHLENGRVINIIDTPGMFDTSADPEFIRNEIVSCIGMARDGIHAVLVVFSVCSRFSEEEHAVVDSLVALFGSKIYDYMIVVFTSGDELEEEAKNLNDFLRACSEQLKEILQLCGNRCVLFNNRTKDETKKSSQVEQLLSCVNMVSDKNAGEPYTSEIFAMFKEFSKEGSLLLSNTQLNVIIEKLEAKFNEIELKYQKLMEEERAAREKAESEAREEHKKHEEELKRLNEQLANAKRRCSVM